MLPNPDPTKARTPHRRQAFTQLPQGSKNALRELNRQRGPRVSGPVGELRVGKRLPDGTTVWLITDAEQTIRNEDNANLMIERAERKKRIAAMVGTIERDSWARKV